MVELLLLTFCDYIRIVKFHSEIKVILVPRDHGLSLLEYFVFPVPAQDEVIDLGVIPGRVVKNTVYDNRNISIARGNNRPGIFLGLQGFIFLSACKKHRK